MTPSLAKRDRRLLCISLRDVAPATLDDCRRALELLDSLRAGPVALLVVPDYFGQGRADRDARFAQFIESRLVRGDEIVLHGYRHTDPSTRACGAWQRLSNRFRPGTCTEFARLDFETARARLLRGLVILRSAGWHPTGFVAPEWRMSASVVNALEETPLRYFATRDSVTCLRSGQSIEAPGLIVDRPGPRWFASAQSRLWAMRHAGAAVLRVALHPAAVRTPATTMMWRRLLGELEGRDIVTEERLMPPLSPRSALTVDFLRGTVG